MEITEQLHTTSRGQWREWLAENHSTKREIWISTTKSPDGLQYLDAVEEALCFGWIDSTIKAGEGVMWRRFSPRRKRSPWTELNKERCRRLERLGLMTDAGRAVLPNMDFEIDDDVLAALQCDGTVWQNFQALPALYPKSKHNRQEKNNNCTVFYLFLNLPPEYLPTFRREQTDRIPVMPSAILL